MFEDDEEGRDEEEGLFESMNGHDEEEFPTFFGCQLAGVLGMARKSLVLLRAAKPDHPLLSGSAQPQGVRWLWSEGDVESAWARRPSARQEENNAQVHDWEALDVTRPTAYKSELAAQFGLFDLEPGTMSLALAGRDSKAYIPISTSLSGPVQSFVSRFPTSLSTLTPTLTHLNELTFAPLVAHASELSDALLGLFLPKSSSLPQTFNSNLNLTEHLILLRSYILLTSHAFKSRLAAALFSDSGEYGVQSDEIDIRARARQIKSNSSDTDERDKQWAVGLTPALTDRKSWPPGGADLSFLLRTVIVDSLDESRPNGIENDKDYSKCVGTRSTTTVLEEAEWRIGFAIRDLPAGAGRDRWLNPTCE
jgi:hypothetical protein